MIARGLGWSAVRILLLLLTPVVVWAASFLGAWAVAGLVPSAVESALGWLIAGGFASGLAGLGLWVLALRRWLPRADRGAASPPSSGHATAPREPEPPPG